MIINETEDPAFHMTSLRCCGTFCYSSPLTLKSIYGFNGNDQYKTMSIRDQSLLIVLKPSSITHKLSRTHRAPANALFGRP